MTVMPQDLFIVIFIAFFGGVLVGVLAATDTPDDAA